MKFICDFSAMFPCFLTSWFLNSCYWYLKVFNFHELQGNWSSQSENNSWNFLGTEWRKGLGEIDTHRKYQRQEKNEETGNISNEFVNEWQNMVSDGCLEIDFFLSLIKAKQYFFLCEVLKSSWKYSDSILYLTSRQKY